MRETSYTRFALLGGLLAAFGGCPQQSPPAQEDARPIESLDSDNDGLTDDEEVGHFTNPLLADTDGDGLMDGDEVTRGTSPILADTDFDTLSDSQEISLGTDPTNYDSDGDLINDAAELALGLDPLVANETNAFVLEIYREDFVALATANGTITIFKNLSTQDSFLHWKLVNRIIINETQTQLINVDTPSRVTVTYLGQLHSNTRIEEYAEDRAELTLRSNVFRIVDLAASSHMPLWSREHMIVVARPCEEGSWSIINTDRCENAAAEPISSNLVSPLCP